MNKFLKCFETFEYADKIIALTGAGVSTLSGIPDFRGKNGFYSQNTPFEGFDRETLFDIDFFYSHPDIFYRFANEYLYPMLDKTPSICHNVLASLQKKGIINAIYTQNIDCLHTKAGAQAYELHGSLYTHICTECGDFHTPLKEIRSAAASNEVPCCHCGGILKPDVVFYGENLNEKLLDQAFTDFENADIVLVFGSSLTVAPVSSLPMTAKLNHSKLVIVNEQPTSYDRDADFIFPDIKEFCTALQNFYTDKE